MKSSSILYNGIFDMFKRNHFYLFPLNLSSLINLIKKSIIWKIIGKSDKFQKYEIKQDFSLDDATISLK